MSYKNSFEKVKQKFEENGLVLLSTEYNGNKQKLKCQCPLHKDKELWISYNDLTSGHGCKYCGIEKRVKNRTTPFDKVVKIFEQKGYKLLSNKEEYKNSTSPLQYICLKHPDTIQTTNYTNVKRSQTCSECIREILSKSQRKDFEIIKNSFESEGYILLSTEEEYKNSATLLKYKCPRHLNLVQTISWGNFVGGHRCRYCSCKNSKGEKAIREYLANESIAFQEQKRFQDLRNPKTNYQLPYDFFLPDYNLLIEFQGGYHDGRVHEINPKIQTKEQWQNLVYRDKIKKQYAISHGYNFLEIWYWDYENINSILAKELKAIERKISRPFADGVS